MTTLNWAYEYVDRSHEAEGEQRAEFGMGCKSLGYDPGEWAGEYGGYRCCDDPVYVEAKALVDADLATRWAANEAARAAAPADDLPF
jgi:hypothetical protein